MIPGADSSAGERRLVRMAAMLAERTNVDLVAAGSECPGDESTRIRALRMQGVRIPFGGRPVHLVRMLMGRRYELILAESWTLAEAALPFVRRHQPEALFAVDTIDLHFLRDARLAEMLGSPDPGQERNMARELGTYHGADLRVFVSDVERDLYQSLPDSRSDGNVVIPIIVEREWPERAPQRGDVVFVGALWHHPNLEGITWFCSEIWPQIRTCVPDARLRLIGSNAWSVPIDTRALSDCPGVTVEGYVADLSSVYAETCAAVAPLRFGAGMKGKVCEAMAAGVPVVTTSIGAEGIEARPGRDLLVADGAASFADAVVSLLADDALAGSVGAAGAVAIHAQCGADVVRPAVHGLLRRTNPAPSAAPPRQGWRLPRIAAAAGWRFGRRLQALCQHVGR